MFTASTRNEAEASKNYSEPTPSFPNFFLVLSKSPIYA